MAVRNLTKNFLDIRNGAKANRSLAISTGEGSDTESGLLKVNGTLFVATALLLLMIIFLYLRRKSNIVYIYAGTSFHQYQLSKGVNN